MEKTIKYIWNGHTRININWLKVKVLEGETISVKEEKVSFFCKNGFELVNVSKEKKVETKEKSKAETKTSKKS